MEKSQRKDDDGFSTADILAMVAEAKAVAAEEKEKMQQLAAEYEEEFPTFYKEEVLQEKITAFHIPESVSFHLKHPVGRPAKNENEKKMKVAISLHRDLELFLRSLKAKNFSVAVEQTISGYIKLRDLRKRQCDNLRGYLYQMAEGLDHYHQAKKRGESTLPFLQKINQAKKNLQVAYHMLVFSEKEVGEFLNEEEMRLFRMAMTWQ